MVTDLSTGVASREFKVIDKMMKRKGPLRLHISPPGLSGSGGERNHMRQTSARNIRSPLHTEHYNCTHTEYSLSEQKE